MRVLLALLVIFTHTALAIDLDSPGAKPVTVKTEIQRGESSGRLVKTAPILEMMTGYVDILKLNQQENKDSDGFKLGWSLSYYLRLVDRIKLGANRLDDDGAISLATERSKTLRREMLELQRKFELSDKLLCEAIGMKYDAVKPELETYAP